MTRETMRQLAHEIYPHADDGVTRPLTEDVPYLYARAQGFEVRGTGWFHAEPAIYTARTHHLINAREIAFLADALRQGLVGDEAWEWVQQYMADETGELAWDRAEHYGVPVGWIKPYPCGDEPDKHEHQGPPDREGWHSVTYVSGTESECVECTFEVRDPTPTGEPR